MFNKPYLSPPAKRAWRRLMLGLTAGLALCWSWMFFIQVAQLSASVTIGYVTALFAFVVTLAVSLAIMAWPLAWLCRQYYARPRLRPWFVLEIILVWALAEFLMASGLALVWWGHDGRWDSQLAFASFTPLLMYTPFKFLARLVGFYGLSALFVGFLSTFSLPKLRRWAPWLAGVIGLACLLAWLPYHQTNGPTIEAQIVAERLTEKLPTLQTDADLVVLPEYGLDDIASDQLNQRVQAARGQEVYVLGSKQSLQLTSQKVQNVLIFGTTKRGFLTAQPKARLVPAGEYLPYVAEWSLRGIGAQNVLEAFRFERAVQKGSRMIGPVRADRRLTIGAEVCASIVAPDDYRHLVRAGASVLTNSASLQIFNGSPVFTVQHEGFARFMAVANARPMLQSSNGGQAFMLDHNGNLHSKIWPMNQAVAPVATNYRQTPYSYLGEWLVWLGALWLSLRLLIKLAHRYTKIGKRRDRHATN